MRVTNHAVQRWVERFGKRSALVDLHSEFKRSAKWNFKQVRKLNIRIDTTRRYHVTEMCIFVVAPQSNTIITVLPRTR